MMSVIAQGKRNNINPMALVLQVLNQDPVINVTAGQGV
jgi:hypothetical protein